MQNPPAGWPRIIPALFYQDAAQALDWLCRAFGFELRLRIDGANGRVEHSELAFGEGVIMVGSARDATTGADRAWCASPKQLGGSSTHSLTVCIDDVDAHCRRARAAGAKITAEPSVQDYGPEHGAYHSYRAVDPEGQQWYFMRCVREPAKP